MTMKNAVFWDMKPNSYLTESTLLLRYSAQPVNIISTISGFHGGDYEECRLLECYAVLLCRL
jgi:hypothetical protein